MQRTRYTRTLLGLVAIGLLASTISLPDSAQAQTTSNGPYYATPSWDQTLPSATRFVILSNFKSEAVLDRNTGLVWEKSPHTATATWLSARHTCINRNIGGQKGWRLPAIAELASLIDPSVGFPGPTLPAGHPFTNVQSAHYWSASSLAEDPTLGWGVVFGDGNVFTVTKSNPSFVWCVRGGSNAEAY
jgi:hypothetical protein